MLIVDDREVTEHPEIPQLLLPIPTTVERIEAGDYIWLSPSNLSNAIERCEVGNLLQKLRSGELESQLTKCIELYNVVYLLTEGVYDGDLIAIYKKTASGYYRSHVYPNTHYEYLAGALAGLDNIGVRLLHTATFDCSMKLIKEIYKPEHSLFKKIRPINIPVKLSANTAIPKLLALCPRLPEKVAIRLILKYDSIWKILQTPDEELLQIEGFGRTLLSRLKEGVGKHE